MEKGSLKEKINSNSIGQKITRKILNENFLCFEIKN